MIKLISSDMDGTLLDDESRVPPETFYLIKALRDKGVRFCAGSGRRLDTLMDFFGPVCDMMDFVASNGTQVMAEGKLIDQEFYSYAAVKRLKRVVDTFDALHLVLFDRYVSFLLDNEEVYEREMDKDLPRTERMYELPGPEVSIIKISIFCDDEAKVMDMSYVLSRELSSDFTFAPSGRKWIDVMQNTVSKKTGIQQVMDYYGILPSEVMAFGDSMNDYEILSYVEHSRAMANGRYAIKAISEKVIGPNTAQAVQLEMRELLESLG